MSIPSQATLEEEEEEEEEEPQEERNPEPSHHPTAPSDELFDISTTVDPGYIISLIRQLLPPNVRNCDKSHGVNAFDSSNQGSEAGGREESAVLVSQNNGLKSESEVMDAVESTIGRDEGDNGSLEKQGGTVVKDTWENCGCILWDLAASKTHAEFMVQNLALDVLLANLMVPQSVRVTEITLGIIGNLACHEVPRKRIASTNGLIEVIVDQLFLDDTPCLCEACRVLTLGLQGCGSNAWAEALGPENILSRVLWVAVNTLNPQLMEKSVGLLLAILQSEQEVVASLLPKLMQLGLPGLLVNLLMSEMSKLAGERVPERYPILDLILRTIEALSVVDDYSHEISSNVELFRLLIDLVKFPDKVEVANSCVTAAILIANILTDVVDPALEMSQGKVVPCDVFRDIIKLQRISSGSEILPDLSFLQGLFDIFPFASEDIEARSAIWSIIARLLVQVQVTLMSPSSLHQYVAVFLGKSEVIEDELLDHSLDSYEDGAKLSARTTALGKIISILGQWTSSKESMESNLVGDNLVVDETIVRLLECCRKSTKTYRRQPS